MDFLKHSTEKLKEAFDAFRKDPIQSFRVKLRRVRAEQIRNLLSNPDAVDLAVFNRDIWPSERETLHGVEVVTGLSYQDAITPDRAAQLEQWLDAGELELHGNYVWGAGARVFGAPLKDTEEEKTNLIRQAVRVLNDSTLTPSQKVEGVLKIRGFGPNITTGLVMLFHPDEFAICNKQSKGALSLLGHRTDPLDEFQKSIRSLRDKLGATDFLELDWFLYLIKIGRIPPNSTTNKILSTFLTLLASAKGFDNQQAAADWLMRHEWGEILVSRRDFYTGLGAILREDPGDVEGFTDCLAGGNSTVLGGSVILRMCIKSFLENPRAPGMLRDFLGDCSSPPIAEDVTQFINRLVECEFKKKDGGAVTANAALFCSVILSAVFPKHFVDYRQGRWKDFAAVFELGAFPKASPYGEQLLWAGRAAGNLAGTETFKKYFIDVEPYWIAAGLAYLLTKDKELKAMVQHAHDLVTDGDGPPWPPPSKVAKNLILYGPPGTGKTYISIQKAVEICDGAAPDDRKALVERFAKLQDDGRIAFVTFHQSYGYEEFVEGIQPVLSEDAEADLGSTQAGVAYVCRDGVFKRICALAKGVVSTAKGGTDQASPANHVLIVDEINRGNISKILGELITLLEPDKRLGGENELKVTLPYSLDIFGVPSNLYIIGTMNTADRSIAFMDTALRRRFEFQEMMPDLSVIRNNVGEGGSVAGVNVAALLGKINKRIELLYDRDHQIGHSYLMKADSLKDLRDTFLANVIPLLQEYFYGDWEKLCIVLGCPYSPETGRPITVNQHPIIKAERLNAAELPGADEDYEDGLRYVVNPSFVNAGEDALAPYFAGITASGKQNPEPVEESRE